MPKGNKRKSQSYNAANRRWSATKMSVSSSSSDDDYRMELDDKEVNFKDVCSTTEIGDLAEMCKSNCDMKCISTLIYMSLRFFDVKWDDIDDFLKNIGLMTAETANKWSKVFIKGDYEEFSEDLRGGKQTDSFYDIFPEIEADARAFVVQKCSQKSAAFKATDLVDFVNERFHELVGIPLTTGTPVRSERSCRVDLRKWGAKFEANSQRPYFEGHERQDVVEHRNEFINYFLTHKDFYYTITDAETPMWNIPTQNPPRILLCKCVLPIFSNVVIIMLFFISTFTSSR